jgi:hypothetical protein
LRLGVVALTNVGGPIERDIPMSEPDKIEDAILGALVPLRSSNPPVCASLTRSSDSAAAG